MSKRSSHSNITEQNLPPLPDIRQSACHTIVAAGFLLINLQNPFQRTATEGNFHFVIMIALPMVVALSWYFFYRRLMEWRKVPSTIRNRVTRTPLALKNRALSHMLMALLASGLTALGYLGYLATPTEQKTNSLSNAVFLAADSLVGVIAIAILTRTIRDYLTASKATSS